MGNHNAWKVIGTFDVIPIRFPDSIRKCTSKRGFILLLLYYRSDDVLPKTFNQFLHRVIVRDGQ